MLRGSTLLALLVASAAYAGDERRPPARHALGVAETWRAGDTFVETGTEDVVLVTTPLGADGAQGEAQRGEWKVSWTADAECVDAGADGEPSAMSVTLRSWETAQDAATAATLARAELRATNTGFRIVAGGTAASALAKAWLRAHYGEGAARDDAIRAAVTPDADISTCRCWTSDVPKTAAALEARFGFPVAAQTVCGTCRLTRLDADAQGASIDYDVEARLGGGDHEAAAGIISVKGTAEGPVAQWSRLGSFRDVTRIAAEIPGAHRCTIVMTEERSVTRSPGTRRQSELQCAIDDCVAALEANRRGAQAWSKQGSDAFGAGDLVRAVAD